MDDDPVLPVTDEGMPDSIFIPLAALLFELTAEVKVPIRVDPPPPIYDDVGPPPIPPPILPVPPKLI